MLEAIRNYFNCGNIVVDNAKFSTLKYLVSSTEDLNNTIIPHFDKYPLIGSKNLDFLSFKDALKLFEEGKRLDNYIKIIQIKESMNKGRSSIDRYNYLSNKEIIIKKRRMITSFC